MRLGRSYSARPLALFVVALGVHCAAPPSPLEKPRVGRLASAATWDSAVAPIRIRASHTATLLGTGDILVAGGAATPKSTELIDPLAGRVVVGSELVVGRSEHTATMLLSGKVLLAGGAGTATAELYDPVTRTSVATGSMTRARAYHAAVRLRSGKVLVVGGGGVPDVTNEIYDPQTGTWTLAPDRQATVASSLVTLEDGKVMTSDEGGTNIVEIFDPAGAGGLGSWSLGPGAVPKIFGVRTATRLHDGRVLLAGIESCRGVGGANFCQSESSLYDPAALTPPVSGPSFSVGRLGFTAARTPQGQVLFIGGDPLAPARTVERFDPGAPAALVQDGETAAEHLSATATVLPGGDVLTLGGSQAAIDRRITTGSWRLPPGFTMTTPRKKHAAVRLHDGTVLATGGESELLPFFTGAEAEIIDPVALTVAPIAPMTQKRVLHTMTALRTGKVLVAGGGTASAEIYDPAAPGARFTAIAPMTTARSRHAATLLPSGQVLITGGDAVGTAAEIFDPATTTFTALPPMTQKRSGHGAVLMPTGEVLVVGESTAEIFSPVLRTFRVTSPPGASREGRTAHLLPNGKVFVAGGDTLAADVFDPVTETWSFTKPQSARLLETSWVALPDGRLVGVGGRNPIRDVGSLPLLFDGLAVQTGSFVVLPTAPKPVYQQTTTLAGSGEVVSAGGDGCYGGCQGGNVDDISVYGDGAPDSVRPVLSQVPAKVVAGARVTIGGSKLANLAEASDGTRGSSAVNHPVAVWVSDAGDAVLKSTIIDFSDTSATWLVPTTALFGHGMLFVSVAGVTSRGASVEIEPAPPAIACAYDPECKTGFCVDGVCCDRRCDGACEGCSKARKTNGEDGVCGAVPPGRDIAGRCVLKLGDACTAKEECGPNFCSQGVCCDSSCEGQCLACNQPGLAGKCSAINEGACGAACDGDHTLKQIGAPDVDCAPFKCAGPRCNTECSSARDCVAPAVCSLEGKCVPGTVPSPSDDAVCGCRVVGRGGGSSAGLAAAVLALAMALVRRGRRSDGAAR